MRGHALLLIALAGTAFANVRPRLDMRRAVRTLIPGMPEPDARRLAHELGCETIDDHEEGQLDCLEGTAPPSASWTLWFQGGKLARVDYAITIARTGSRAADGASQRMLDQRAAEVEAAISISGERARRVAVKTDGIYRRARALEWTPTRHRTSKILLTRWTEEGKSDDMYLRLEIVAPSAAFSSYLVEHQR